MMTDIELAKEPEEVVRVADAGQMRLGPLVEIPHVLRTLGVDPAELLSSVGLGLQMFQDSDNVILFTVLGRLLLRCSERTACDHFGLLVGSRAQPSHFGLVGNLMSNAPNLGAAITDWASNQDRFVRGSVIHLLNHEDACIMTYRIHHPKVPGVNHIVDTAVSAGFSVLRTLSKQRPVEVWLPRRRSSDLQAYKRVFGMGPRFDATVGGLAYSQQALSQPIEGANAAKRRHLKAQVCKYRAIELPTFADQVRRQLGARITTGTASKLLIASELKVHEREMSHRLREAGTTFRELSNEIRFEVACQLLANTDLTAAKIAEALHYNDASAFLKAFQRSAGMPPLAWRARAQR